MDRTGNNGGNNGRNVRPFPKGLKGQPEIRAIEAAKTASKITPGTKRSARNSLNGVTAKQEHFIQNVIDGMTFTDAYRNSYNIRPDTKNTSIHVNACKLMQNASVKRRLRQLELEKEEMRRMAGQTMHARVIERLEREASDRGNPASVRVRALELLGKTVGAFKDVTEATVNKGKTINDLEQELRDLLDGGEKKPGGIMDN